MFKTVKLIIIASFIFIVGMFILRGTLIVRSLKSKERVYEVVVNSYNGAQSYLTNEYTKDKETGCITFKDEVGIKRIVCNSYTITEY